MGLIALFLSFWVEKNNVTNLWLLYLSIIYIIIFLKIITYKELGIVYAIKAFIAFIPAVFIKYSIIFFIFSAIKIAFFSNL